MISNTASPFTSSLPNAIRVNGVHMSRINTMYATMTKDKKTNNVRLTHTSTFDPNADLITSP